MLGEVAEDFVNGSLSAENMVWKLTRKRRKHGLEIEKEKKKRTIFSKGPEM